ncbi:hypothetical protein EV177_008343 [Coemansia sp. RSA 1804]|nr:hypothetical protein EV177_008343 [Coemansia sp. RSA 1804]
MHVSAVVRATTGKGQARSSSSAIAGDRNLSSTGSSSTFGGASSRYAGGHSQPVSRLATQPGVYGDAVAARSPGSGEIYLHNASNSSASSFYSSSAHPQQQQQPRYRRQVEPPPSSSFASADQHQAPPAEFSSSRTAAAAAADSAAGGGGEPQSQQLSVLHESDDGSRRISDEGSADNERRLNRIHHMAQNSTDHTPCISSPTTPSMSAVSLTAASSSFSFRNSVHQANSSYHPVHNHSQKHLKRPQHQNHNQSQNQQGAGANTYRYSSAISTSRDSMFLRLKEKMKSFKPRSRPQSDNLSDKRMALNCASTQGIGSQYQQHHQSGTSTSPSHGKPGRTNSKYRTRSL